MDIGAGWVPVYAVSVRTFERSMSDVDSSKQHLNNRPLTLPTVRRRDHMGLSLSLSSSLYRSLLVTQQAARPPSL